jgi:hypothetical protein
VFDIKPKDAIEIAGSSNIAVMNMPGAQPVIQSLGPNKSSLAWSGLLLHEGAKESSDWIGDKGKMEAFDRAKMLEAWQKNGTELKLTFGPLRRTCLIQYFKYAIKRFNHIEYQINLVLDKESDERKDIVGWYKDNYTIDSSVLLGGKNSPLNRAYEAAVSIQGLLGEQIRSALELAETVSDNSAKLAKTTFGILNLPISSAINARADIARARSAIESSRRSITLSKDYVLFQKYSEGVQ